MDCTFAHPEAAAEYAELKRSLSGDYEHNRDGYTEAKGAFIKRVTKKAMEEKTSD
ncbi:MAG: GrpB family protein [Eubacteriales bacterium]